MMQAQLSQGTSTCLRQVHRVLSNPHHKGEWAIRESSGWTDAVLAIGHLLDPRSRLQHFPAPLHF